MDNLNYVFFEEFKRLDKLCGDLYGDQHGITKYIDEMRNVPGNDYRNIPNWKADLEQLIRIRHIRNKLAHTEGAFHEEMCKQKDIDWSKNFYERILNQSDPIAMLYQYSRAKQQMVSAKKEDQQYQVSGQPAKLDIVKRETGVNSNTRMKNLYWVALFLLMVVVVSLVVFGIVALLV